MSAFWSAWTWKMAWRDARPNRRRLFIYVSAIIIGVAAQVAITSFRDSLTYTVNNQAKELLGADLEVHSDQPYSKEAEAYFDSLGGTRASGIELSSMVLFPKNGGTRLANIHAIKGPFPFYGNIDTSPAEAAKGYKERKQALVDQTLMTQLGISPGDSIKIGTFTLPVAGAVMRVPGEAAAASMIAPRIYIPAAALDSASLLQRGSRAEYIRYFKFEDGRNMAQVVKDLRPFARKQDFGFDTVRERQQDIGRVVNNLGKFLNLVGFIALLLGGIGVASSIHVYIKQKINTAAILRCFGASSQQTISIFLIQALVLGFTGAVTGTLLGIGIQYLLPGLFSDFLPVSVELTLSWLAIGLGLFTGTGVALVFALMPLMALQKASPLFTMRSMEGSLSKLLSYKTKASISLIIALAVAAYASLLTQSWIAGPIFTIAIAIAFGLLLLVAKTLMKLIKTFFPSGWPYVWRQGLANLYRPHNQTTTLMLSIGLGMLLVSTLYFSQEMLMKELHFASRKDAPNLIFFDIQPDQNKGVNDIIKAHKSPVLQNVPMVTMRIDSINGRSVEAIAKDSTSKARHWALRREYRSTYRDSLIDSETLLRGTFIGKADPSKNIYPVSPAENIVEDLNVGLGDTLTFNVQGVPVRTYISSIREVDFQRVQPNFFMLFPTGILESAPQIFVTVTRVPDEAASAAIQQAVVQRYPNISAIDVTLILTTINTFIDKISFAVQFMALFSIITGLIVLAGSVVTSRFQRVKESVLLRTLGASKKQIIKIISIEYLFLGILSAFTGLILSVASTWLLGYFYFDLAFIPDIWIICIGTLLITLLTILIGMVNSRSIYRKTPLEVLRLETS